MTPTVAFNKADLIKHLEEFRDAEIEKCKQNIADAKDNEAYDEKVREWRRECERLVTALSEKVSKGEAEDADLHHFRLPEIPDRPSKWQIGEEKRSIERITTRYRRMVECSDVSPKSC